MFEGTIGDLIIAINRARVENNSEYSGSIVKIETRGNTVLYIPFDKHDDSFAKIIDIGEK